MAEIKVNYSELHFALIAMKSLQKSTGYGIYCTSDFLNHSRGKMFEQTNEFYRKLMEVEEVLIEIIKDTIVALNNAGVEFAATENYVKAYTLGTDLFQPLK